MTIQIKCWILFLVICNVIYGQSQITHVSIDKLLNRANKARFSQRDSSQLFYLEALTSSDQIKYPKGQIESRLGLAWVHYVQSDYETSKKYYKEILNQFPRDMTLKNSVEVYTRIGTMYLNEGNLDTAGIYFTKVQEIQADAPLDQQTNIGTLLSELYYMLGRHEEAEQYILQDYKKFKNGPKRPKAVALYALMQFYLKQEQLDSFVRFNNEYLESIDYENLEPEALKFHYHSLFSDDEGNRDLNKIDLLIEAALQSGHDHIAIIGYAVKCEQLNKDNRISPVPSICEKAVALCDSLGWQEQKVIFINQWTNAEAALSNWKKAYSLSTQREQINQDIKNTEVQYRIDELQVKFETSEKEKQLQQQQFEIAQKTRQRNISLMVIGAVLLFAIGIYLALKKIIETNKRLASQAQKIQDQKIEHLEIRNQINILDSLLAGQEGEQKRIANDLHDGLGSLMATTKTHFHHIGNEIDQVRDLEVYQKTGKLIEQSVLEVRRISHNMMPKTLSEYGLEGAILDIATTLEETHTIKVSLETIGLDDRLPEKTELMVFRIIQEIVNNVVKHANASSLFIQIIRKENRLYLLIEDDGKGFDLKTALAKKGLGLKSLQSRVSYLNGHINFDTIPGQGTTVMADIPL